MDAGATAVRVEIRRGGMGLIRVSDDGCGIAPVELPTAFLRHATSKLRSAEDLGSIGTLGFRGEALAAIAAVSRWILTRPKGAQSGASSIWRVACRDLSGGGRRAGGHHRDGAGPLYNTPARLKFMKKTAPRLPPWRGFCSIWPCPIRTFPFS